MEINELKKRQLVYYRHKHQLLYVDSVDLRKKSVTCNDGNIVIGVERLEKVDEEVLGMFGLTIDDILQQKYSI